MIPYYDDGRVQLWHGQALECARELTDGSVSTIVTSPPYFGLRDYGEDGQIGAEATIDGYVGALVTLFRELRRTLADDGTAWVNLGDSYSGAAGDTRGGFSGAKHEAMSAQNKTMKKRSSALPDKNLMGVPWRVAFALQADGWILRSEIIWAKPNPMPESVTDRPTKSHEHVFLFAKSERYYYNAEAIGEAFADERLGASGASASKYSDPSSFRADGGVTSAPSRTWRNARDVWEIATQPFSAAHFAVYPEELPRRCIRAGARPGGVVLDPFSGSGTTGKVALMEGRTYIGFDLNSEYLDLSLATRFAQQPLDLGELDTERV